MLALVSWHTGTWREVFREQFVAALTQRPELSFATFDANLCFVEYYRRGARSTRHAAGSPRPPWQG